MSDTAKKPRWTWDGIRSIFRKELLQLMRDPYLVAFIITLPIIQLVISGLAIQRDLKHIETIVCNYDQRNASYDLLNAFDNSTFFDINDKNYVNSDQAVFQAIRQGRYRVGIIIPPDYSSKILSGSEPAEINVVVDGANASIAKGIVNAASLIVAQESKASLESQMLNPYPSDSSSNSGSTPAAGSISLVTKVLYNPDLMSAYFLIPGILAIIMHMMTILFTSFAIVRERENGTLEQLMVTPIRVADLMIGKVLPYAAIGFLDMILTLIVMVCFFEISISGNFWFLCGASVIFILTSLGIGLLISTTCQSQVQAIQLTMGLLLPSLLISGFVFPLEPMPWFIKIVSYSLPLTYYLEIIRGVVIKGTGFMELWPQTVLLTILAIVLLGASINRFKKQVV
ncbi:MAG: ABC transporter permease [Cyanobacteria bacterium]|nr:ABC transporter permease [Cyanobacteriota bacterium]